MQTDQNKDREDQRSPAEPPANDKPVDHSHHSGEGSSSALAKMKLWERARARFGRSADRDRKPQAD